MPAPVRTATRLTPLVHSASVVFTTADGRQRRLWQRAVYRPTQRLDQLANLWKPLIDAFGPVLGEDGRRAFHPYDDRIVELGLHHRVVNDIGHDVIVDAWWATA